MLIVFQLPNTFLLYIARLFLFLVLEIYQALQKRKAKKGN